jgi:glycosyltransferase involved in cell wall biosynthesis
MHMKQSIAILITNFEGGGAQKVALTHAYMFQNLGYNVHIIAIEHQESYHIPDDFSVHFLSSMQGQGSKLKKLLLSPTLPFKLANYLKKNKINLCISHLERADFVNILAKFINKHKTIAIIHSHLTSTYKTEKISFSRMAYKILVQILEPFNNKIIAVSNGIADDLIRLGLPKNKIQVILNPFDINYIRHQAQVQLEKYVEIFNNDTIISIGRLSNQKGLWHSILAFNQIKKSNPTLKYIILGDGPLREYHLKLANDLGLSVYNIWDQEQVFSPENDVFFLGFQANPFQFIDKSKILILPSHFEGLPNVLVESLIIGTPVIATDVDAGPRELLSPETDINYKTKSLEKAEYGIIVPVDTNQFLKLDYSKLSTSEEYIKKAIDLLLNNQNLRNTYINKSKTRVNDFAIERIIPQWKTLLESVLSK